jgi:hypothetical protein
VDSAGGIRTHGLELMRLARTAGLLYRATPLAFSGLRGLVGWIRTSALRFPKPAGWPSSPTTRSTASTTLESNQACRRIRPVRSRARPSSYERLDANCARGRRRRTTSGCRLGQSRREELNLRLPPSRGGALGPLSYGEMKVEPRGLEPRTHGCKPRVLPVSTRAPC